MLNNITSSKINFSGNSFKFPPRVEFKDFEVTTKPIQGLKEDVVSLKNHLNTNVKLERKWGMCYATHDASSLPRYEGSFDKTAGFSTESGRFGGGWLKADLDKPLSTSEVHDCVAVQFVNEPSGEHFFYHILFEKPARAIAEFVKEKFPNFHKVNIVTGDHIGTQQTTNSLLKAIKEINPETEVKFYHFPVDNPEIVAYKGDLNYISRPKSRDNTFLELVQYDEN